MKVLVNFNEYLGGGETLLLRLVEGMSSEPKKIISSYNSYIHIQAKKFINDKTELCIFDGDYNFNYLGDNRQREFLIWLDNCLPISEEVIEIITFCLRDLHTIIAFINAHDRKDITVVHLLLHPLDHLYLGQTIIDKLLLRTLGVEKFSLSKNLKINSEILNRLAKSGSLIPMNDNVLRRLKIDTGISIDSENIIPLPFSNMNETPEISAMENMVDGITKIVWLGRIVDFKISAIKAMIDFISVTDDYTFDIIGYGNESLVNNYISKKSVGSKVKIIGRIPHDQLSSILSSYHIGYGMGTSMAELSMCGLPTIVALASPDFKSFKTPICAGLVFEQKFGNVGDDLYCTSETEYEFPRLIDAISQIQRNPQTCLDKSLIYIADNFSLGKNIKMYEKVIDDSSPTSFVGIERLSVNRIRKILFWNLN